MVGMLVEKGVLAGAGLEGALFLDVPMNIYSHILVIDLSLPEDNVCSWITRIIDACRNFCVNYDF